MKGHFWRDMSLWLVTRVRCWRNWAGISWYANVQWRLRLRVAAIPGDRLSDVLCLSISSSQIFQLLFYGKRYARRACMYVYLTISSLRVAYILVWRELTRILATVCASVYDVVSRYTAVECRGSVHRVRPMIMCFSIAVLVCNFRVFNFMMTHLR